MAVNRHYKTNTSQILFFPSQSISIVLRFKNRLGLPTLEIATRRWMIVIAQMRSQPLT
jgi:hypothetical protein